MPDDAMEQIANGIASACDHLVKLRVRERCNHLEQPRVCAVKLRQCLLPIFLAHFVNRRKVFIRRFRLRSFQPKAKDILPARNVPNDLPDAVRGFDCSRGGLLSRDTVERLAQTRPVPCVALVNLPQLVCDVCCFRHVSSPFEFYRKEKDCSYPLLRSSLNHLPTVL